MRQLTMNQINDLIVEVDQIVSEYKELGPDITWGMVERFLAKENPDLIKDDQRHGYNLNREIIESHVRKAASGIMAAR